MRSGEVLITTLRCISINAMQHFVVVAAVLVLCTVAVFGQYANLNANFGRTTTSSCNIANGNIYVNGQLLRPMNADDFVAYSGYMNKVNNWKENLRQAILEALPFHLVPGKPLGLREWPFGPYHNPFYNVEQEQQQQQQQEDQIQLDQQRRKRRFITQIAKFPDRPTFCDE